MRAFVWRVWGSPVTLAILLLLSAALGMLTDALQLTPKAPSVPGWDWSEHPNAVLVCYQPSHCGCGDDIAGAVMRDGELRGIDVLVVTSAPLSKVQGLVDTSHYTHARLIAGLSRSAISRMSSTGRTTLFRVRDGHIVRKANGGLLSPDFLQGG